MGLINIKPGNKLTISAKSGYYLEHPYVSRVEEVLEEDSFLVQTPIDKERIVELPLGIEYAFTFYADGVLIQAKGIITEQCVQNKARFMKIKINEFQVIQRRGFYRVNSILDFTYTRPKDSEASEAAGDMPVYKGVITNISGGGLRFASSTFLTVNERIVCNLVLGNLLVTVEAEVRVVRKRQNRGHTYVYGVEFVHIAQNLQNEIARYVLRKQLEIIKKTQQE